MDRVLYKRRIPADDGYLQALGGALFNWQTVEWAAVYLVACLGGDLSVAVRAARSGKIDSTLRRRLQKLPIAAYGAETRRRLEAFSASLGALKGVRGEFVHAHPATSPSGFTALHASAVGRTWEVEDFDEVAARFEQLAIEGLDLFYGSLRGPEVLARRTSTGPGH